MPKLTFRHAMLALRFVGMAAGSGCGGGTLDQPTTPEPAMNLHIRFAEPVPEAATEVAAGLSPIRYCPAMYYSSPDHPAQPLIPTGWPAAWRTLDRSAATMQLPVPGGSYFSGLGCLLDAIPLVRFFQVAVGFGPGQRGLDVPYDWMSRDAIVAYTDEAIRFTPFGPPDQPIVLPPGYSILRRTCGSSDESWRVQLGAPDEPIDVYPAAPQFQPLTGPSPLLEQNERALLEGCGIRPPPGDLGTRVSFDRAVSVAFSANSDQLVFLLPIDPGDPAEGAALRSANLSDGSVRELAIVPGAWSLLPSETGDIYLWAKAGVVQVVPQSDGSTLMNALPITIGPLISPDGRWISYSQGVGNTAAGTYEYIPKLWDVAAGAAHAIDNLDGVDLIGWSPDSLLVERHSTVEEPGYKLDLVAPASGQVVKTYSFASTGPLRLVWGSDGPVDLVTPTFWAPEEQVSLSKESLDRVQGLAEQGGGSAGLILRDPNSETALNVLDASAGRITFAASTTGAVLLWTRRCLGLFETICSFNLHRVTVPGGDDQVVAVADSAAPVAISPAGDRIAIAARDGVYVRDLP